MLVSLLKKLGRAAAALLIVSFVTFLLMYGDGRGIAQAILGMAATPDDVTAKVVALGLDRPLLVQYFEWLGGALTGDLGRSYFSGLTVTSALASRVPVTLSLVIVTLVITIVVSVLVGVTAAYFGGWFDRVVQFVAGATSAIPGFIVAVVLVFAFAVSIPVFPATGYLPWTTSVSGWVGSITLPVLALLIGSIAGGASQIRGAVIDTLSRDFVRTLRARGISEKAIVLRHVLRSASAPGLIAFGLIVIGMLGGVVFVEQVFALPGMGQLATLSAQQGDVPMVMGSVVFTMLVVLVVNFVSDLVNTLLNPRARAR